MCHGRVLIYGRRPDRHSSHVVCSRACVASTIGVLSIWRRGQRFVEQTEAVDFVDDGLTAEVRWRALELRAPSGMSEYKQWRG